MSQRSRRRQSAPPSSSSGSGQQPVDRSGAGGYNYRLHADGRVEIVRPRGSVFVSNESNPAAYAAIIAEVGPYPAAAAVMEESGSDTPFLDEFEESSAGAAEAEVVVESSPAQASQEPVLRNGSGGYTYRLHAGGLIEIVKASGSTPITAETHPSAYAAIVAEVGAYPTVAASPVVEEQAPAAVEEVVADAPQVEEPTVAVAEEEAVATTEDSPSFVERVGGWLGMGQERDDAQQQEQAVAIDGNNVHSMDRQQLAAILADPATHGFSLWAAAHARDRMLNHQESFDATGVGTIEGVHAENKTAGAEREDCTTFILETLEAAFVSAGKGALWNSVKRTAIKTSGEQGFKGIELMKALQAQAGWKSLFWAPDTQVSADESQEHTYASAIAERKGTYYGVDVEQDMAVTDYRKTDGSGGDQSSIEQLKQVPVGVLAARGGTHMALMINGAVYEVHWSDAATERNAVEATPLENWGWLSGMVTAPGADLDRAFGQ